MYFQEDSRFVSYDDWHEYLYETLIYEGVAMDDELIEKFINISIEYLAELGIVSGTIEIELDE